MTLVVRASDFIDSLGVNTHLDFNAYGYQNLTVVEQSINYLGIENLRDSAAVSSDLTTWQQVAQATGAKFDDYIGETSPSGMSGYLNLMPQLANEGTLNFIEGGNEEDDPYPASLGNTPQYAAQFQQQVYAMGQQLGLPVINMSFGSGWTAANNWQGDYGTVGDLSAYADYANAHTYPGIGQQTDATIQRLNGLAELAASQRPVITTEIGWDLNAGFTQQQVAKYVLDATMDGIKDGDVKTYFYALFNDGSGAFGLMNQNGTPTTAGTALHDLTTLLSDTGATARRFTPTTLNYALSGTISGDNQQLIEKSNGSYWLVLWNETETAGSPHNVTLSLPSASEIKVFDPLIGTSAISDQLSVTFATISLPDHPELVEIVPDATTITTNPAPSPGVPASSTDLSVVLPSPESVVSGSTTTFQGISINDVWAASNPGSMALNVWDDSGAGTIGIGGKTSTGTGELSFSGTLTQLNADLAGLNYMAGGQGTDGVTIDIWNQAGVEVTRTLTVNVGPSDGAQGFTIQGGTPAPQAYDITLDPSQPSPTISQSNVSIYGTGSFSPFIGGQHDTALLIGGTQNVQAYSGYNSITTGAGNDHIRYSGSGNTINAGAGRNVVADSGSQNIIVMPTAGNYDDIFGFALQNNDTFDLRQLLAATNWNGAQSTLDQYLAVGMNNNSAVLYARDTPTGSLAAVSTFESSGTQNLQSILAHAIT